MADVDAARATEGGSAARWRKTRPPGGALRRLARSRTAWLVAGALVVYNTNLRSVTSFDTYPTRYLPISILSEGNLDLDEFAFLRKIPDSYKDPTNYHEIVTSGGTVERIPYYLMYGRGHYLSAYPVMTGILAAPIYAIPVALGLTSGATGADGHSRTEIVGTLLAKLAASIAVALSVGWVHLAVLARRPRAALPIALLYAFATSSWSVSSQGLWQSSMSQPLIALGIYLLVRAESVPRAAVFSGLPLALAVACRPPALVFAVVFAALVFLRHRRHFAAFAVAPAIVAAAVVGYNVRYFGAIAGGYATVTKGGSELLESSASEAILGLLVSPSRGIFIYSPFLLFAFYGLFATLRRRDDPLLVATSLATLLTFAVYAKYKWWFGSFSYSYRYLVDLLPGLALLMTVPWSGIVARPFARRLFLVLALWSLGTQIVGAFFYPCGWYDHPRSVRQDRSRLWDWKDPEIVRCLCAGPVEPDGLRLLRSMTHRGAEAPAR
ncbi:MAG: hypothetical protein U0166_17705 [Acidobacteriota bacterium]